MADAPSTPPSHPRAVRPPPPANGGNARPILRLGMPGRLRGDAYHFFLSASWRRLLASVLTTYALLNTLFAVAYLRAGGVDGMRPGSFSDAFFFSVQTMSTIGYGTMAPRGTIANVLVSLEALIGLLAVAMATGLMFSKFARPNARVLFSHVAVVSNRDGVPSLLFRMANERSNQIVEATLHVSLLRSEVTVEGEAVRRFYDLQLVRASTTVFTQSWTAIHPIVPGSPLHGLTPEQLAAQRGAIVVSLMGFDDTFSQTVHARHIYESTEVVWGARFVDMLVELSDGRRAIDYERFHDYFPVEEVASTNVASATSAPAAA